MTNTTRAHLAQTRAAFFDWLLNSQAGTAAEYKTFDAFNAELSAYLERLAPHLFNPAPRTRKQLHAEFCKQLAAA